ncbi:MAG: fibronectin type III domain-containing protein [Elusimicrobia bacterium]|nr:fibronectin type III domain-containing protein [Elusimicrobiota bacterium]
MYSVRATQLSVRWMASRDNIKVVGYRIDLSLKPDFSTLVQGYQDLDVGNVTNHFISGLKPLSMYYVRIRSRDAAGNRSPNSVPLSAKTSAP